MKALFALVVVLGTLIHIARADDIKLSTGAVLKDAQIQSVWPDGVVVSYAGKVTKYWWRYLAPGEQLRIQTEEKRLEREAAAARQADKVGGFYIVTAISFGENQTTVRLQPWTKISDGFKNEGLNMVEQFRWVAKRGTFQAILDEPMPKTVGRGDQQTMKLFSIGHTNDSARDPLYTTSLSKALDFLATK